MNSTDDSRKYWAELLAGQSNPAIAWLNAWLGLGASLVAGQPPGADLPTQEDSAGKGAHASPEPRAVPDAFGWVALMAPLMKGLPRAMSAWQGVASGQPWTATNNPLARILGHPAMVAGNDNSQSRLSMQAGVALSDFMKSAMSHQALQIQGWTKALRRFVADFQAGKGDGAQPVVLKSLDDVFTHWSVVGEAALQEHSRSEQFLASQAQVLRSSMGYRIAKRRVIEAVSRENDVPTLTDLDEAFAAIHELRNEVRTLRRLSEAGNMAQAARVGTATTAGKRLASVAPGKSTVAKPAAKPTPARHAAGARVAVRRVRKAA